MNISQFYFLKIKATPCLKIKISSQASLDPLHTNCEPGGHTCNYAPLTNLYHSLYDELFATFLQEGLRPLDPH